MKALPLDEILALAATTLPAAGVRCLLIGGFAVNHYRQVVEKVEALRT